MKIFLLLMTTVLAAPSFANFEAAYIDMQAAIQATTSGKNAKKSLEAEFNKKKDELKKKEGTLKKEADDFEKKRMVLSEKVREEKQMELQKKMMEFQQELQQSQTNIQKKERDLTQPILVKIQKIIAEVASKKGYSMVFEKASQSVMWAKSDLDITDEVVKEFEKSK
jgi:outer membrane protein